MAGLSLEVLDYEGPTAWRWRLTDDRGSFLADFEVRLDSAAWQYEAFSDLTAWLKWRAAPDHRLESEAQIVTALGEWVGTEVIGEIGPALVERSPCTVVVSVPREAELLAYRPLELGHVDGKPLALQGVSTVFSTGVSRDDLAPIDDRLRMLSVFSLPTDASALNLRRERFGLGALVREIAQVNGKAVEFRVVQYGATRERLESVLLEDPGWDIVHISGHGLPAGLLLEHDDGSRDAISTNEFVKLLRPTRKRLKLALISSCESAALTAEEHLRLLGLAPNKSPAGRAVDGGSDAEGRRSSRADGAASKALPAVASELARELDCAVIAMRYAVADEFAIRFAEQLYDLILAKRRPVAGAVALALPRVVGGALSPDTPATSVATPAIFGARAVDLRLVPPDGAPLIFEAERQKLAHFPPQPQRFVGRVGPMIRATAALAPRSGSSGVVFVGMAGAGKTACALELAYTHEESFARLVFHEAPAEGMPIAAALAGFALSLDTQLPGVGLAQLADDRAALSDYLPRLTEFLENNRVLVVLDNVESLLAPNGSWRDDRWQVVVDAFTEHGGLSRLVMTSRRRPATLPDRLLVEPVHALSASEAVLLARELPNLRRLLDGDATGIDGAVARQLAAETLSMVQGHPKLIELADGGASDLADLEARLSQAGTTWKKARVPTEDFFERGEPIASPADYVEVLDHWARAVVGDVPSDARLMFQFLACLEDDDRDSVVVETAWPVVWEALDQSGTPPPYEAAVTPLVDAALVGIDQRSDDVVAYHLHPAIAATGVEMTGGTVRSTIDAEMSRLWLATVGHWLNDKAAAGTIHPRAGPAAAPYLFRNRSWGLLAAVIGGVVSSGLAPIAAAALVPMMRDAVAAAEDTDEQDDLRFALASLLDQRGDPAAGERVYREVLTRAEADGKTELAAFAASALAQLLTRAGRFDDALELADRGKRYTIESRKGPWTQIASEIPRLQALGERGHNMEVLETVERLRKEMTNLPYDRERETVDAPKVRETVLDAGRFAAMNLGRWDAALEAVQEILKSKHERAAPESELARTAYNATGALLAEGRLDEARGLLVECDATARREGDWRLLSKVATNMARVEKEFGRVDQAIELQRDALRYTYIAAGEEVGVDHYNLANYLLIGQAPMAESLAHRLVSAIFDYQMGSGVLRDTLLALGQQLEITPPDEIPGSFEEVRQLIEQTAGVHVDTVLRQLPKRAPTPQAAMDAVLDAARKILEEEASSDDASS